MIIKYLWNSLSVNQLKLYCKHINCQSLKSALTLTYSRGCHSSLQGCELSNNSNASLMEFSDNWPSDIKEKFLQDMTVIENFITPEEESSILGEIEPYLKRMRYERDHWDDAIQGFRETERKSWYPKNKEVLEKVIKTSFPNSTLLPHVHVLDLEASGFIKPHVDSVKFCGTTISGISLLSNSVMRLVQTTEGHSATSDYRDQPKLTEEDLKKLYSVKILLRRNSLYIMKHTSRYNFTHEILKNEESFFKGEPVIKSRRISVICRNEPTEIK